MTYIIADVCVGVSVRKIILVFTGNGNSNTMPYIIACVYAGVAVIVTVIIVVFTGDGNSNTMTYIIAGVCAGVAVIVIIVVVIVCLLIKSKKGNVLPMDSKSAFWRVQPNGREPTATSIIPPKFPSPPGHVETNMFDMELPEGRGNLLPPLSPQLPVVESTTTTN